jgi:lipopolysaccharide assembly outer membrane protein LptD (OstA)
MSHTAQRGVSGSSSSSLVLNSSWNPTEKWSVAFNTQYDLRTGDNTAQSWSVRRKIHCWEMSFDRRLLGGEWQYYLRINVTDLPDIQAERGDRFRGRQGTGTPLDDLF